MIFVSTHVNQFIIDYFKDTFWDTSGSMHFVAFTFAGLVAYYLNGIRRRFPGSVGSISAPMLISVGLLSSIHLWELLTESWKIIPVTGDLGEFVEMLFWVPVYLFIVIAFVRFRALTKVKNIRQ